MQSQRLTKPVVNEVDASNGRAEMGNAIDAMGDWFVVHTKSRQEKALVKDLKALRVPYFLPLVSKVRYHGRRKATVAEPLFPGYVFLRGEIDQVYQADRTKRVANVIKVADQLHLSRELGGIDSVLCEQGQLDPHPYIQCGMWVEVRSGPFKGVQGLVEHRKQDRLVLQISTLGQASSLEIDGSLLDPIEPAIAV